MKELENKIREVLPRLQEVKRGQRFLSPYYGIITATNITDHGNNKYSVYGFDEDQGLPRDNYYPKDLELLGFEIKLNDVLEFLNIFFITDESASNVVKLFNGSEKAKIKKTLIDNWDLSSILLRDQSNSIKDLLNSF